MSTDVLRGHHIEPGRLQPLLDGLRQMLAALNTPLQDCDRLSARYRRDTGIACRDIGRAVDAELTHLGLLDIGWRSTRRPMRR